MSVERLQFADGLFDITGAPVPVEQMEALKLELDSPQEDKSPGLPGSVDVGGGPVVQPVWAEELKSDQAVSPLVWPGILEDAFLLPDLAIQDIKPPTQPRVLDDWIVQSDAEVSIGTHGLRLATSGAQSSDFDQSTIRDGILTSSAQGHLFGEEWL